MNETPLTNSLSLSHSTYHCIFVLSLSVSNQTKAQIERLDDGILVKTINVSNRPSNTHFSTDWLIFTLGSTHMIWWNPCEF